MSEARRRSRLAGKIRSHGTNPTPKWIRGGLLYLAVANIWTWLVSRDPKCRGYFLIGQVSFQQRFEFVDALIASAFVDDGHADGHKVDRLWIRAFVTCSATAGRCLDCAVGYQHVVASVRIFDSRVMSKCNPNCQRTLVCRCSLSAYRRRYRRWHDGRG